MRRNPLTLPFIRNQLMHFRKSLPLAAPALALAVAALQAQPVPARETAHALAGWVELDASPGDMQRAVRTIRDAEPAWAADAQGNLLLRRGEGRPRRVVACGLDHPGYVVSAITEQGYLRLHRSGNARVHPLWDQSHQAQQVVIHSASGPLSGVVANPNGHFARQHRGDSAVVGVDDLWVDVGALSARDVERMGIALMDPVYRDLPAWIYAGHISGADASGRVGCAAVAGAARRPPEAGETIFVLSAQRSFRWSGLNSVLARLGTIDELVLVTPAPLSSASAGPVSGVIEQRTTRPSELSAASIDSVLSLAVRSRWPGSLVESVSLSDADSLLAMVVAVSGAQLTGAQWLVLDQRATRPGPVTAVEGRPADAEESVHDSLAALLTVLAELPGAPGHEWRVRDAIRERLPAWARSRASVDDEGNLIVAAGPQRDTTVFIAHLDEVAYEVDGLLADGRVSLVRRGGVIPSAWEGQPALLHFDASGSGSVAPSLAGVFVPRDTATLRAPFGALTAWFGLDSAAMVASGAVVGSAVTGYKRGVRLGDTRYTARGLDDRAGSLALLRAVQILDPEQLGHHVIFVWSAAEESGLVGASALAMRLGPTVRRVYAIDTFVSSDTPLEEPIFAHTPLGAGPVLRALDDGIAASREERDRIMNIARGAGIAMQVGTTHGSTDATAFVAWGALGAGLSWPGRYSHSPAEVLDLRDLAALVELIGAVLAER